MYWLRAKYVVVRALFFAGFLSGCMVGPKYKRPKIAMPTQFEGTEEVCGTDEELCGWWKQFNDPMLDQLIAEAVKANYDIRLAVEKIAQARAQYRIEGSYLWPEIDAHAAATRTRISQNIFPIQSAPQAKGGTFLPTFLNLFQLGFDAIWELDFFGKFRHGRKAAQYAFEATKEDAESVMISMLSEVAVTYINIRALQRKIDLQKKEIEADERQVAITERLFQIGLDNELQKTTLMSAVESDRAILPTLQISLKQSVYALAFLLGKAPEGLFDTLQNVQSIPTSTDRVPVGLPSDLLRRRPDIRSAERQLAAATEQSGAAVADLFPHIALTGISFGGGNQGGSSVGFLGDALNNVLKWPSRTFSVGVGFNWDMLDFGRVRGNIQVKTSLQKQALLTYEQTVIGSLRDVENALVAYFEEQSRKESFNRKVEADSRTLEITENLFQIGLANEVDLLKARKTLLSTESLLVESEQALAGDLVALYKALGGQWQSAL